MVAGVSSLAVTQRSHTKERFDPEHRQQPGGLSLLASPWVIGVFHAAES